MTRDEWLALAERCERATDADRQIDADIFRLASEAHEKVVAIAKLRDVISHYTASLDAITALIERELPAAWAWTLGQNIHHRTWGASINNLDEDGAPYSVCWGLSHHTPALALCAAFCRAMAEKEPT